MNARKYIGKVLPDGHLSLPEEATSEVGKVYEVILVPLEDAEIYPYAEAIAREKGFAGLSEAEVEKIVHESRDVR